MTPRPRRSKQRFIADGDKLCSSLGKRFARLVATRVTPTPAATLRNASEYSDLTRELSTGLARLTSPNDAEGRRIVDLSTRLAGAARQQKLLAERIVSAADRRDAAGVRRSALAFNEGAFREKRVVADPLDRLMRSYGFKNCGRAT